LQQKCPAKNSRATIGNRQNKVILMFATRNELRQQYKAGRIKLQGKICGGDRG